VKVMQMGRSVSI